MTLVGALVEARAFRSGEVRAAISQIPGLEVHGVSPDGRFIVTAGGAEHLSPATCLRTVEKLAGVISVAPIGPAGEALYMQECTADLRAKTDPDLGPI